MPRLALALGIGVVVAGALAWFVPFLVEDRVVLAGTPSPPPRSLLFSPTLVSVPPGERTCVERVLLDPDAEELAVAVKTLERPAPAVTMTLSAPGFAERRRLGGGYPSGTELRFPVDPPSGGVEARACFEHAGRRSLGLVGTRGGDAAARTRTLIAGTPVRADVTIVLYERGRRSFASLAPEMIERMSAFRPGFAGEWLLWALAVLVLLGVPGGSLWALKRAFDEDAAVPEREQAA